jgi:hypothetical protein
MLLQCIHTRTFCMVHITGNNYFPKQQYQVDFLMEMKCVFWCRKQTPILRLNSCFKVLNASDIKLWETVQDFESKINSKALLILERQQKKSITKFWEERSQTKSQSQSYLTIDGQSASLSWYQATIWDPRPIFLSLPLILSSDTWGFFV